MHTYTWMYGQQQEKRGRWVGAERGVWVTMLVLTMKLKMKSIKTRMKMSRDDENWDEQIIDEDKENEGKDGKK